MQVVDRSHPDAVEVIRQQRRAWDARPLVRRLYRSWFAEIDARLAPGPGPTVEIGAGCGSFKEFRPEVLATDVFDTPWADLVMDAERLRFDDGSLANLVMIDVLHHLPHPLAALREAERVLSPGGRLVMLEPYCAPFSALAYRIMHEERLDLKVDPEDSGSRSSDDPFDANIAIPTVLFWRHPDAVDRAAPRLRVVERRRLSWLVYPLSGGFSKRQLVSDRVAGPLLGLERLFSPLMARLAGFRCLVTLERV